MTISSQIRTAGPYAGAGVVAACPFSFKVFQASDLLVTRTNPSGVQSTLALSVDYTVTLNADQNASPGGLVTTLAALPAGYSLGLTSNIPITQPLSLTNTGGFYPRAIEDELDRLTILMQQQGYVGIGQTLRVPEISGLPLLPVAASRANNLLAFDSSGNPVVVAPASGSAADVVTSLASTSDSTRGAGMIGFAYALAYSAGTVGRWLKDLALSTGASFIGWIQAGTGAVTRTVQAKLREPYVSVLDYGADPTNASDSTAAFNLASAYLKTQGGGALFIPKGTYRLDGQFLVDFSNVRIFGAGMGATVLRLNAWVDGIRVADGYPGSTSVLTDITIENLTINGDRAGHVQGPNDTNGNGINVNACDRVVIRNVEVYDQEQQGIVSTYWQVAGRKADSIVIDSCIVRNTQSDRIAIGIEGRGRAAKITDNAVVNGGSIYIGHESGSGTDNGECIVSGNRCEGGATGIGIAIRDNLYKVMVEGNIVKGYDVAIRASSVAQALGDFNISDNECYDWVSYGILVSPMFGTDSANALVDGNKLSSITGVAAIAVAKGSTVTANRIQAVLGVGISATGGDCEIFANKVQSTGYSVDLGASTSNVVVGNRLSSDLNDTAAALANTYFANYGSATNRGSDYYVGINRVTSGNAAPVTGTWRQGDVRLNNAPSNAAGQPAGWLCCVAGSPGTWRAYGVTT